jgi:predicted nucleic acid-binding protein
MKYFIDTSAFIALINKSDRFHKKAVLCSSFLKEESLPMVTSNFVLDETYTWLVYHVSHQAAIFFGESLQGDANLKIISVDEIIEKEAWSIFKKYKDQKFSYTDCTSFVIMKLLNLKTAFSFDKHFTIFGFEIIPSIRFTKK